MVARDNKLLKPTQETRRG